MFKERIWIKKLVKFYVLWAWALEVKSSSNNCSSSSSFPILLYLFLYINKSLLFFILVSKSMYMGSKNIVISVLLMNETLFSGCLFFSTFWELGLSPFVADLTRRPCSLVVLLDKSKFNFGFHHHRSEINFDHIPM